MIMQILSGTPKWVFVLFAALLWLGVQQMLPRRVGLNRATLLPLAMTGLSLYGVASAFGGLPLALLTWLAGTAMALAATLQLQSAAGASIGMQPSLAHDSSFALIVSGLYGAFSGIFLARAARLWRIALQHANTLQTA